MSGNLAAPFFLLAAVVANQSVFRLGALPLVWTVLLVAERRVRRFGGARCASGRCATSAGRTDGMCCSAASSSRLCSSLSRSAGIAIFHSAATIIFTSARPIASPIGGCRRRRAQTVRVPTLDDVASLLHHPARLLLSRAVVLALLVIATALTYRWRRLAALLLATVALTGWGLGEATIFLRYPAGGYFAAMPFLGPAFFLHNVELAGRSANVAAPVVWLFVLRPWLHWALARSARSSVRHPAVLAKGRDLLFRHRLSGAVVVHVLPAGGGGADCARIARRALGCLLIGAAAAVKEPAILALPLVWLAGAPWRKSWREVFALSGAGVRRRRRFRPL